MCAIRVTLSINLTTWLVSAVWFNRAALRKATPSALRVRSTMGFTATTALRLRTQIRTKLTVRGPCYGYSKSIVARGDFVFKVATNLDPAAPAPLLCAGITVYSPLIRFGAGPSKKVLIAGLGGLGPHGRKSGSRYGRRGFAIIALDG